MGRGLLVLILLLLGGLPLFQGTPEFWITQLNYIGLASLVVLGLVLLTGVGGMTSFGQAAFVGIGAYATAWLTTVPGWSPWLALALALGLTIVVATILGAMTVRLSGHFLPLCTLAWGLSLYYLFGNLAFLGQYDGIVGIDPIELFGIPLRSGRAIYYLIWLILLLAMWATHNLLDSRPGRAIRALKSGSGMAESFGVDTKFYRIIIFVYAALLACLSGWLYAHMQRAVSPGPFGLNYSIEYLFMAVVGGAGSVWGAVLGSSVILLLKDQIQNVLPKFFSGTDNYELIVFGVLMVLVIQYARNGIWPVLQSWAGRIAPKPQVRREPAPPSEAALLQQRARPSKGTTVLTVERLRKEFGGLVAVDNVSFSIQAGEIMGLIGPNGAGKSTIFNLITGMLPMSDGIVSFMGRRLDILSARAIATLGVARTFQHVQLLHDMTVLENVALGAHLRSRISVVSAAMHAERESEARLLHEAAGQLQRVGLGGLIYEQAGNLALGQQRLLEIARALAADPILLLLDEPAAGLRYKEKQELAHVLAQLRSEGMSILLVEHDMDFVMNLTDRLVVMDFGIKLAEGLPAEIQKNPAVLEAYLGGIDDDVDAGSIATPVEAGPQNVRGAP